jgi:hypothetical protein
MTLFLIGIISAYEFDNVKTYDAETKTATITNGFGLPKILGGEKIAEVSLKSEQNVQVGLGYQKVFEYEITSLTDYNSFIKQTEVYNLKNGNQLEDKQIDLKYLTYEDVEIEDYKEVCSLSKNGTETCSYEVIGTHTEQREVWKDLTSNDLKIETKRISGWTDVKQGDYYEWIPEFAGIKVEEWAWGGMYFRPKIIYLH